MTKVINLYAGPGTGKSTTAAGLFYEMKLRGFDVELVREYVKTFAYCKREHPSQPYIFAKQLKAEGQLYGQVDWIITDSPLHLSAIYGDRDLMLPLVQSVKNAKEDHNFFLTRYKPYHTNGRYETEEEARHYDTIIHAFLVQEGISYHLIRSNDRDRVTDILATLGIGPTVGSQKESAIEEFAQAMRAANPMFIAGSTIENAPKFTLNMEDAWTRYWNACAEEQNG